MICLCVLVNADPNNRQYILIKIQHADEFVEMIPLVIENENDLERSENKISFKKGDQSVSIDIDPDAEISVEDKEYEVEGYQLKVINVKSSNNLSYTIKFVEDEPVL